MKLWKIRLPTKIKVFMWMAIQKRLQTGTNLKKKKWKGSKNCCLCGVEETEDHIFSNCHVTKIIWFCFKEALGWDKSLEVCRMFLIIGCPWGVMTIVLNFSFLQ